MDAEMLACQKVYFPIELQNRFILASKISIYNIIIITIIIFYK